MPWIYLLLAGCLEVGFTTAMQFAKTTKAWWPHAMFLVCIIASFYFLALATEDIPVGTAYAVWTGIGAAGTAILGIAVFGEPASALRLVFLTMLIGSVIGLNLVSSH
jgi:quaternary ammonium compound-resistance protein SugE